MAFLLQIWLHSKRQILQGTSGQVSRQESTGVLLIYSLFRQTVSRILALEALPKGIQTEERFVDVAAIPMGIDVAALSEKR